MTAAEFAKWSCVALIALGMLAHVAINVTAKPKSPGEGCSTAGGVVLGLLLRAWLIVAICLWWHA